MDEQSQLKRFNFLEKHGMNMNCIQCGDKIDPKFKFYTCDCNVSSLEKHRSH